MLVSSEAKFVPLEEISSAWRHSAGSVIYFLTYLLSYSSPTQMCILSLPITRHDTAILPCHFLANSLYPESGGEYEAVFSCGFREFSIRDLQHASRSERSSSLCCCQNLPICWTSSCSYTWTWRRRDWSPTVFCKLTSLAKWMKHWSSMNTSSRKIQELVDNFWYEKNETDMV